MIDFFYLENSFGETVEPKARQQETERRNHRHQSEIGGAQHSREDDSPQQLDGEDTRLRKDSDSRIANC